MSPFNCPGVSHTGWWSLTNRWASSRSRVLLCSMFSLSSASRWARCSISRTRSSISASIHQERCEAERFPRKRSQHGRAPTYASRAASCSRANLLEAVSARPAGDQVPRRFHPPLRHLPGTTGPMRWQQSVPSLFSLTRLFFAQKEVPAAPASPSPSTGGGGNGPCSACRRSRCACRN